MKVKITFVLADNSKDTLILTGESIAKLQEKAQAEYKRRGAKDAWSENFVGGD